MANKKKGAEAPKVEPGEARIEYMRLADIKPAKRNPKSHEIQAIVASIKRHGFVAPPIENAATGRIVAGHGRKEAVEAIKAEGLGAPARVKVDADGEWMIPVVRGVAFPSEVKAEEYLLGDNRLVELGGWDEKELAEILSDLSGHAGVVSALGEIASTGWTMDDLAGFNQEAGDDGQGAGSLAQRFLVPPFSVLDARQGYWQDRKRAWLSLGIKSELGRVAPIGGGPMPLDRQKSAAMRGGQRSSRRQSAKSL